MHVTDQESPKPCCDNCLWYDPTTGACRGLDSPYTGTLRHEYDDACKEWQDWDIYGHEIRES